MLSTIVQTLRQRRGLLAFSVFVTALLFYVATLAPGLLWGGGDFSTFQTRVYTGEIEATNFGHPLWVILARPFTWLPIRDIAYRVNLVSAVFAALTIVIVFYTARDLTRSIGASGDRYFARLSYVLDICHYAKTLFTKCAYVSSRHLLTLALGA